MAKRFTDTDKWKKPFIRGLTASYKLLWLYILDECDHAGIWQVDFEVARIKIGEQVDYNGALGCFGERVQVINKFKWFIPDFIAFQYGELNEKNRLHYSVLSILKKNKVLISPLEGAKDKDKEKEKDKDKEKEKGPLSDDFFNAAFDDISLGEIRAIFPLHDIPNELLIFKLKCRASPDDYRHRDAGGIRQAFIYQLKHSKATNGIRDKSKTSVRQPVTGDGKGKTFGAWE